LPQALFITIPGCLSCWNCIGLIQNKNNTHIDYFMWIESQKK
jgi:hypothetical protein